MPLFVDNDDNKPIMTVGVIPYRFVRKSLEVLLVDNKGFLGDMCLNVEDGDNSVDDVIARGIGIKFNLKGVQFGTYVNVCRHVVYFVEVDGVIDGGLDVGVKLKWISADVMLLPEVIKYKLLFRLKSRMLFGKIRRIMEDKRMSVFMF